MIVFYPCNDSKNNYIETNSYECSFQAKRPTAKCLYDKKHPTAIFLWQNIFKTKWMSLRKVLAAEHPYGEMPQGKCSSIKNPTAKTPLPTTPASQLMLEPEQQFDALWTGAVVWRTLNRSSSLTHSEQEQQFDELWTGAAVWRTLNRSSSLTHPVPYLISVPRVS